MRFRIRACLAVLTLALATPAGAELYRCPGGEGPPRFVGDPSACRGAVALEMSREIQRNRPELPPAAPAPTDALPMGPSPSYAGELEPLFVPVTDLQGPWEIVREAPTDVRRDPVLIGWGVRAIDALHYTRIEGRVSQVCSVEIWAFENPDRAESAERGFERRGWRFLRRGNLLVSVRAVTVERGRGTNRTLFADCHSLADRTGERAEARLR